MAIIRLLSEMLTWFKKLFVAHEENDHQPHILRKEATLFFILGVIVIQGAYFAHITGLTPGLRNLALVIPTILIEETNETRRTNNLTELTLSPTLQKAAQAKADDMAQKGYFSHTSIDGFDPWHWFDLAGYNYLYAGENLAVNFTESRDVINGWMNSPTHRANMLDGRFTEIAIATAEGTFEGRPAVFVVQLFGRPAPAPITLPFTPVALAEETGPAPTEAPTQITEVVPSTTVSSIVGEPAVKGEAESQVISSPIVTTEVRTLEKKSISLWHKILSDPRASTNALYFGTALILILSLFLNFLLEKRSRHPHLFLNCLAFVGIIFITSLFNHYLALAAIRIS